MIYALIVVSWVGSCGSGNSSAGPICASIESAQLQQPIRTFKNEKSCATALAKKASSILALCAPLAEDRTWHLLVQTYGGTVTLLHDLTKREADMAAAKLSPPGCNGCTYTSTADTVKSVTVFQ